MKHCPKCSQTYTDETLNFCLDDGEWLTAEAGEPETAILPSQAYKRIPGTPTASDSVPSLKAHSNSSRIAAAIIGLILLLALGAGSYLLYSVPTAKQISSIAVMPFVNES